MGYRRGFAISYLHTWIHLFRGGNKTNQEWVILLSKMLLTMWRITKYQVLDAVKWYSWQNGMLNRWIYDLFATILKMVKTISYYIDSVIILSYFIFISHLNLLHDIILPVNRKRSQCEDGCHTWNGKNIVYLSSYKSP